METKKSGPIGSTLNSAETEQIALRQVTRQEWESVPRTIPNFWVAVSVWVPMGIVLFFLHDQVLAFAQITDGLSDLISLSTVTFVVALIAGSGRQAPWLGLAIVGISYYFQPRDSLTPPILIAALAYYGLLSILVAASDARFRSLLRSWHREATGRHSLSADAHRSFGFTKYLSPFVWKLALGALAYPAIRLAWEYFSTETNSLFNLDSGYRFDLLVGMSLVALCILLCCMRWVGSRSVGLFVVEIPVDVRIGPISWRVLGQAIPTEHESWKCGCRDAKKNESKKEFVDPRFIFVSDVCKVHGIEAVNKLSPSEFLGIAQEPWVYGHNLTGKILAGTQQNMAIVGLTGWGSRPVAVPSSWSYGGGQQASNYYAPRSVREPLSRSKRTLKVIDPADNALSADSSREKNPDEIDRIALRSLGINAEVVRVRGARPLFV